jgi:uncharacterized membrane protein YcaP (DUF421 family)
MDDLFNNLLGLAENEDTISAFQMMLRAVIVFFITVAYVRISGMRTFGSKTAFDAVIYIILGAILSRTIVAASPFFPTLLAGLVLVFLHRAVARITLYNEKLGDLLKGEQRLLVKNGKILWPQLKRSHISEKDLLGAIRKKGVANLNEVKEAYIERNGEISVLTTVKENEQNR